ncbi:protein arginine methyltransferase 6 [Striga asiatica]|uniref:Protein arginine methyltransferase 6 n=1 Tax=Striga asiatica TaxID=4170 RepID=A0A5A7NXW0_STRAF|nr:protein arginine methyltransferase 6 [Striga asiatica]
MVWPEVSPPLYYFTVCSHSMSVHGRAPDTPSASFDGLAAAGGGSLVAVDMVGGGGTGMQRDTVALTVNPGVSAAEYDGYGGAHGVGIRCLWQSEFLCVTERGKRINGGEREKRMSGDGDGGWGPLTRHVSCQLVVLEKGRAIRFSLNEMARAMGRRLWRWHRWKMRWPLQRQISSSWLGALENDEGQSAGVNRGPQEGAGERR